MKMDHTSPEMKPKYLGYKRCHLVVTSLRVCAVVMGTELLSRFTRSTNHKSVAVDPLSPSANVSIRSVNSRLCFSWSWTRYGSSCWVNSWWSCWPPPPVQCLVLLSVCDLWPFCCTWCCCPPHGVSETSFNIYKSPVSSERCKVV